MCTCERTERTGRAEEEEAEEPEEEEPREYALRRLAIFARLKLLVGVLGGVRSGTTRFDTGRSLGPPDRTCANKLARGAEAEADAAGVATNHCLRHRWAHLGAQRARHCGSRSRYVDF